MRMRMCSILAGLSLAAIAVLSTPALVQNSSEGGVAAPVVITQSISRCTS